MQRWRKKYDGSVHSLANKSTRPHSHSNQHTQEELDLIRHKHRYYGHEGYNNVARKILNFKTPNEVVNMYNSRDVA